MHHIHLSHIIWKDFLRPGMTVIDATCGNGHDTLFLSHLVLTPKTGKVFAIDIQKEAVQNTEILLRENLPSFHRVTLIHASHEVFPKEIKQANLIVYNFGYLPSGNPLLTTLATSSVTSCQNALSHLPKGGLLSLTLYPGHPEGKLEATGLIEWAKTLSKDSFLVTHHLSYSNLLSPSLLLIRKLV